MIDPAEIWLQTVIGDDDVLESVAVDVMDEDGASVCAFVYAGGLGDFVEMLTVVVVPQLERPVFWVAVVPIFGHSDDDVGEAVVVEVSCGDGDAVRVRHEAELFGDIRERVVAVVLIECAACGDDIDKAIVVEIDGKRDAAACQPCLLSDVLEGDFAWRAFVEKEGGAADEEVWPAVVVDVQHIDMVGVELWENRGDILEFRDGDDWQRCLVMLWLVGRQRFSCRKLHTTREEHGNGDGANGFHKNNIH